MLRNKRALGFLLILVVGSLFFMRHALLHLGVHLAARHFFPETRYQIERVYWENKMLLLQGVVIEEKGYHARIPLIKIAGSFSFSPLKLTPHFFLEAPTMTLDLEQSGSSTPSLALLSLPVEIQGGHLLCGEEAFLFSCERQFDPHTRVFTLSYAESQEEEPLLSLKLESAEEEVHAEFVLHEIAAAHMMQLGSLFFPQLQEGWEEVGGIVRAAGKASITSSFTWKEVGLQLEAENLILVNKRLLFDAEAQLITVEGHFDSKESGKPFWQEMMATLKLHSGVATCEAWKLEADSAEVILEPGKEVLLSLDGSLHGKGEKMPLQFMGKGALYEGISFWMELSGFLGREEEIFVSLCSPEKEAYVIQVEGKNLPFHHWGALQPYFGSHFSSGMISGRFTGWIQNAHLDKWHLEDFSASDLMLEKQGVVPHVEGEVVMQRKEEDAWECTLCRLEVRQGVYEALQGDCSLVFQDHALQHSTFKGSYHELPLEASFKGPLSAIEVNLDTLVQLDPLLKFCGQAKQEALPLRASLIVQPAAQQKASWHAAGSLFLEELPLCKLGLSWNNSALQDMQGWLSASSIPESLLALFNCRGTLSCEGRFEQGEMQLAFKGRELSYSRDSWEMGVEELENASLTFIDHFSQIEVFALFAGGALKEGDLLLKEGKGSIHYTPKHASLEFSGASLQVAGLPRLEEIRSHLEYLPEDAQVRVTQAKAMLRGKNLRYPVLVDLFQWEKNIVEYDLVLLDEQQEMGRIKGEGDLAQGLFRCANKSHFFGISPQQLEWIVGKEGGLAQLDLEVAVGIDQLHQAYAFLAELDATHAWIAHKEYTDLLTLPHTGDKQTSPFDLTLHYAADHLAFSIAEPQKRFLLEGGKQGDLWMIEKCLYDDFQMQGRFTLRDKQIDLSHFLIEHPYGSAEGSCQAHLFPLRLDGKMQLKGETPYGKFTSREELLFNYTLTGGLEIERAECILPELSATLHLHQLRFHPEGGHGEVKKIDFSLKAPWIEEREVRGKAHLLFSQTSFALEGSIEPMEYPYWEIPWQMEEISFSLDPKILNVRAQSKIENQPLFLTMGVDLASRSTLMLKVQDQAKEEGISALVKEGIWENIQGAACGLKVHLHKTQNGLLSGKVDIDCGELAAFLPDTFASWKLGKGYSLKGDLNIAQLGKGEGTFFVGSLLGKECECGGYRFAHVEAQVEIAKSKIKISDLYLEDKAGELFLKQIYCLHAASWLFEAPLLQVKNFSPSRLRPLEGNLIPAKPFLISHFTLMDLQGDFSDLSSFVGVGTLNFTNKEVKKNKLFDIPLDLIKDFGLDLDLLTPTIGEMQCRLRGDRLYLSGLTNSFSEKGRSQFFFSNDTPSYITLGGKLHIDLKMHQNVLLNVTELFTVKVRGHVEKPKYSLAL